VARITLTPERFSLVLFDADRVRALGEEVADAIGAPAGVEFSVEVDEELGQPLTASYVDTRDGRALLWYSGGNFEDTHRPRHLDEARARRELAVGMLRGIDRLDGRFAAAPVDDELTDAQRALWEVSAEGRAARAGVPTRTDRLRYVFRLACGFTDEADAAYEQMWGSDAPTWARVAELADSLVPNRPTGRRPVRRDDLRARRA
jgi:hypothetical protein